MNVNEQKLLSPAYKSLIQEAPEYGKLWNDFITRLMSVTAMDEKTSRLSYLSVLAAFGLTDGIPFLVERARLSGATREEIVSAVMTGLPVAGNICIQALPVAMRAYDNEASFYNESYPKPDVPISSYYRPSCYRPGYNPRYFNQ